MDDPSNPFDPAAFAPAPFPPSDLADDDGTAALLGRLRSRNPGTPHPVGGAPRRTGWRPSSGKLATAGKYLVAMLAGVAAILVLHACAFEVFWVPSASMEPSVDPHDHILVEKLSYLLGSPRRGQVVVFKAIPGWEDYGRHAYFVKRVIAVGGDRVACCDENGRVVVNGSAVYEPYAQRAAKPYRFGPVTVPAGDVFVMGDNRADSSDSRFRGPVPVSAVVGRVVGRVWPAARVGGIPGQ